MSSKISSVRALFPTKTSRNRTSAKFIVEEFLFFRKNLCCEFQKNLKLREDPRTCGGVAKNPTFL
jgi:hypothetical protein